MSEKHIKGGFRAALFCPGFQRGKVAEGWRLNLEARVRIELTIEVLQTSALPLGYRAKSLAKAKSPRRGGAGKTGAGDGI